jgi:hypothetical protein
MADETHDAQPSHQPDVPYIDGIDLDFCPRSYQIDAGFVAVSPQRNLDENRRLRVAEFEIARIVFASTCQDVISVYARRRRGGTRYRYRFADEYESAFALTRQSTVRPLSLRELIHLIDTATTDSMELRHERLAEGIVWWQVHEEGVDPERAAGFLRITSTVYPQLEAYYRKRLRVRAAAEVEESDP